MTLTVTATSNLTRRSRCADFVLRAVLIGLLPCSVAAAESSSTDLISEAEFFAEIPSLDTVTRLPQTKSDTPGAVTIIDQNMIRASGARELVDIFRLVPGFQVAHPRGHRPNVTHHGMGDNFSRRMQILIDGRSVYSAVFGQVAWSSLAISIADIERIEVIRGPNTAAYGANAFLGTINIITRHALQQQETTASIAQGNHRIRDALIQYGASLAQGNIRVTAAYIRDDGLGGVPDNSVIRYANMRSDLQLTDKDSLLVQSGISHAQAQEGLLNNPEFPASDSEINAYFGHIRWSRETTADNVLSVQCYYNYRDFDYHYLTDPLDLGPPLGTKRVPVSFDETTDRFDVEIQHRFSLRPNWRLIWGGGTRWDRVNSKAFFNRSAPIKTSSSRLFGNAEWRFQHDIIINAGATLEHTDFTGSDFSPRLAINYHLKPNHTARAVWSRAQRIPSLYEQDADLRFYYQDQLLEHQVNSIGNLSPESMVSQEIGYLATFPALTLNLDVRLYRDKISKFISEIRIPAVDLRDNSAFSFRNEGEIVVNGIDMELQYRPNRDDRIVVSYARMEASAGVVGVDVVEDQHKRNDSVPDYSGSILITHRYSNTWLASLAYYFVDNIAWLSDGERVPAYTRADLRLAREFNFTGIRGEWAGTIQNAGKEYHDYILGHVFETRAFVTLQMQWK